MYLSSVTLSGNQAGSGGLGGNGGTNQSGGNGGIGGNGGAIALTGSSTLSMENSNFTSNKAGTGGDGGNGGNGISGGNGAAGGNGSSGGSGGAIYLQGGSMIAHAGQFLQQSCRQLRSGGYRWESVTCLMITLTPVDPVAVVASAIRVGRVEPFIPVGTVGDCFLHL